MNSPRGLLGTYTSAKPQPWACLPGDVVSAFPQSNTWRLRQAGGVTREMDKVALRSQGVHKRSLWFFELVKESQQPL